jgi:hypothetical protein
VLLLRTLGGDSEFLGRGLTADLTDSLARIPGLMSDTSNGLLLWSATSD